MHIRAHRRRTEGIHGHLVRPVDPAPAVGMLVIVDGRPPDASGRQPPGGLLDPLCDASRKKCNILVVGWASEDAYGRGRRMRVRSRNQHPGSGDARLPGGHLLGAIQQFARHHAAIHHHKRKPGFAVVEYQAAGVNGIGHPIGCARQEHAIHHDRKFGRADICGVGAGAEHLRGRGAVRKRNQEKRRDRRGEHAACFSHEHKSTSQRPGRRHVFRNSSRWLICRTLIPSSKFSGMAETVRARNPAILPAAPYLPHFFCAAR